MKKILSVLVIMAVAATGLFAGGGSEGGQSNYPTKPVTAIVPYPAGGGSDVLNKAVMKAIKLPNGQVMTSVITEGAAGLTGAMRCFNTTGDGYTIMTHNPADVLAYALSGQDKIPLYQELEVVADLVSDYNCIGINKTVAAQYGWKTIEDLVKWSKANPSQKLRWGVVGAQTINMVDSRRVAEALGIYDNITFVPYDGGAMTRKASMGNEIQIETSSASEFAEVVRSGDMFLLLIINAKRIKSYPDVPTTVEKGVNVATAKPRGYFAPKGTDPAILKALADALKQVAQDPEFIEVMEKTIKLDVNFVDGATSKKQMATWYGDLKPYYDKYFN
ncbi:MAG: tripartite tricarboxylate transporter substrate binding protein [Spirochaetales bacterium]|nr:tripartite tricarboxylate transporter substrate binding protein [Spirochaetales bacterium]